MALDRRSGEARKLVVLMAAPCTSLGDGSSVWSGARKRQYGSLSSFWKKVARRYLLQVNPVYRYTAKRFSVFREKSRERRLLGSQDLFKSSLDSNPLPKPEACSINHVQK